MTMKGVRLTRRAERDVADVLTWLTARSPEGAVHWLDAFEFALQRLGSNADHCSPAVEADVIGQDLRQLMFRTRRGNPYRLVFLIQDDLVQILAVRGSGQDLLYADELETPELP